MTNSKDERRRQKTLLFYNEGYLRKNVVNTRGASKALSSEMAEVDNTILRLSRNHLMENVIEKANIKKAIRRVKLNRGAPGVDEMSTNELGTFLEKHWEQIRIKLLNGTYKPKPVRQIEIPKIGGGVRKLGIPTVIDRVIQQAVLQILTPIYEEKFSDHSYGFRPKRSAKQAIKQAQMYINEGNRVVVDIDLEKFFDKVNHDILMSKLAKDISDKRILKLIRRYLQSGAMINGCCVCTEEGTPQGGPISPLLANIMLHDLDKELESRGHKFVRYADDCNVYLKSMRAGERVFNGVKKFVEQKLKLKINEKKSTVDAMWKRKFLGISFTFEAESRIRLPKFSIWRLKAKIRELTKRNWSISMEKRIKIINRYLKGWLGYFKIIGTPSILEELDGWIRRKMRACLIKQWKKPRTRFRKLVSLGISKTASAKFSASRKKYWRLSITPQMHRACGKAYWKSLELVSLAERYC